MSDKFLIFTSAPNDYDYGWNKEVLAIAGHYDDKPVRLINCQSEYHKNYQLGRYMSGMYFIRDMESIAEDIKYGHFKLTPECIQQLKECGYDTFT